jgi:hypothetical protein
VLALFSSSSSVNRGYVLHNARLENVTEQVTTTKDDDNKIRQIRERQQLLANERSKEAAIEMKKKQIEEKQRKNLVAKSRQQQQSKGDILGSGNGRGNGYAPLQHISGNNYR